MLPFIARFLFFYTASTVVWFFAHSYYESILWFVSIKASLLLGQPPFSNPQIIGDSYHYRLGNATFVYDSISAVTLTVLITIPLLLSSSGFSLFRRAQIVLIGLLFLFVFHVLSLLIGLHTNLYRQYNLLLQKGMKIDQLIIYSPLKDQMLSAINRFFNVIFKFVVAVGIWIGLVSYYKRTDKLNWITKML